MDIKSQLQEEFSLTAEHCSNIVDLLDEGDSVPFIARYRKEMHGGTDDQVIRKLSERYDYLKSLQKRKDEIRSSIEGQGKWTDELGVALDNAKTLTEVEDVYRPYKQKKKTRASVAIARGLEPLADIIERQELDSYDEAALTAPYIDPEKGVPDAAAAINGACDIIAERISDDAAIRKALREQGLSSGRLIATQNEACNDEEKIKVYETYFKCDEPVSSVPSHRILAVNRGEKEECLKVNVTVDEAKAIATIAAAKKKSSAFDEIIDRTIDDAYNRLIKPSIENEIRAELTDRAQEQAIKTFELNLKPLLLQPPLKGKTILGLDPAYRTGCKLAIIDMSGKFLKSAVIYPTPPQKKVEKAKEILKSLIEEYNVDCIAIGNGTASKESEIFVAELLKEIERPVQYAIVSEAGASVYSAGELGAEEFPELDLTIRSAISIARRLLDPLAELVKVDVRSLGVGQYQHDMPQKRLTSSLTAAVEDCVNSVGVDLNTASYSLLSYVSGLNIGIAKNIVKFRSEKRFASRQELLKVPKLGAKAFEQCAGFLRLPDGENILDNTAVHPESYEAAEKLIKKFGYTDDDVRHGKIVGIKKKISDSGVDAVAAEIGVGAPTLNDIADELEKPGRDIRDELPQPVLRSDIMDINDLKEGMKIAGVVRNVTDFGAFVDISAHQDGLVHISEISANFVHHPSDVLKVGDRIDVWVLSVDKDKNRIALTMLDPATREKQKEEAAKQSQERKDEREKQKQEREKSHQEYLERQKKREEWQKAHPDGASGNKENAADGRNGKRDFNRGGGGHGRGFNRNNEKRDYERKDYIEKDNEKINTENMSMEEKLKALASKFNKK